MKKLITCLTLGSLSAFANTSVSNDKLENIYNTIVLLSKETNKNLEISPLVCGVSSCKADLIENGIIAGSLSLNGEMGDVNSVNKINLSVYNHFGHETDKSTIILLSDGEFRSYQNELYANYAFKNDLFPTERQKRQIPVIKGERAAGETVIVAVQCQQIYDYLKAVWNHTVKPALSQAYNTDIPIKLLYL